MARNDTRDWDLREIIVEISRRLPSVRKVFLFGSRAFRTNSVRSDIDLLLLSDDALSSGPFVSPFHEKYPPVDLFETNNLHGARSLMNGSAINSKDIDLPTLLHARCLWSRPEGFSTDFQAWSQATATEINFKMTILPIPASIGQTADQLKIFLGQQHLPDTLLGTNLAEVASHVVEITKAGIEEITRVRPRASNWSPTALRIESEYDFQSFVQILLRPWIPELVPEPFIINFGDAKKKADFALCDGTFVIEAKYIDSKNKLAEVVKTLDGLSQFYSANLRVTLLLFLILYSPDLGIDGPLHEKRFSFTQTKLIVKTLFIPNETL